MQKRIKIVWMSIILISISFCNYAQQTTQLIINLAPIDGIEITTDNYLNYQIVSQSSKAEQVKIKGIITWRNSPMKIEYNFSTTLQVGTNTFSVNTIHPTWLFSQSALQELFQQYKTLPQGTMQYCIQIYPNNNVGEHPNEPLVEECLYFQKNDLFRYQRDCKCNY